MYLDEQKIKLIKEYFEKKPVLNAFLFGSVARNQAYKDSDIDILIELDYSKPIGLEFVQMQLDLQDLLNSKVDLVSTKGLSKHIQPYIENEKILIYER
ncbi:MAG: nucleotidyltransferase domain-containing protein [Bacteroidales bacterium]|nr:nucleotidyltransferase domain-containing protein [Bacteroidales bacterium]